MKVVRKMPIHHIEAILDAYRYFHDMDHNDPNIKRILRRLRFVLKWSGSRFYEKYLSKENL